MTEKMIENRVKKLQAIEAQQKELEAQAEAIRAELKANLVCRMYNRQGYKVLDIGRPTKQTISVDLSDV